MYVYLTIHNDTAIIPLSRGKRALIDKSDLNRVKSSDWHTIGPMPSGQYYANNSAVGALHRVIMRAPVGLQVDHQNNNGLDCRRSNLRLATVSQNQGNRHARKRASGLKGVHWHKAAQKWCAQIRHKCARKYLGLFESEESAARAYDVAARRLFGEFANTNFTEQNC